MQRLLLITFLVLTLSLMGVTPDAIVRGEQGQCPLYMDAENVNVRILVENIQQRIKTLQTLAANNPEFRRISQPVINELSVLVSLFPEEVYLIPVSADIIMPMDSTHFHSVLQRLNKNDYTDDKLDFISSISEGSYFSSIQLGRMMDVFELSVDKLKVVELLKDRLIDPENAFILEEKFSLQADKDRFMEIFYNE